MRKKCKDCRYCMHITGVADYFDYLDYHSCLINGKYLSYNNEVNKYNNCQFFKKRRMKNGNQGK